MGLEAPQAVQVPLPEQFDKQLAAGSSSGIAVATEQRQCAPRSVAREQRLANAHLVVLPQSNASPMRSSWCCFPDELFVSECHCGGGHQLSSSAHTTLCVLLCCSRACEGSRRLVNEVWMNRVQKFVYVRSRCVMSNDSAPRPSAHGALRVCAAWAACDVVDG
eukprot:252464-Pleurochrysis_carterae.AAC.4